jgi:hypothetical protein
MTFLALVRVVVRLPTYLEARRGKDFTWKVVGTLAPS